MFAVRGSSGGTTTAIGENCEVCPQYKNFSAITAEVFRIEAISPTSAFLESPVCPRPKMKGYECATVCSVAPCGAAQQRLPLGDTASL